MSVGSDRQGGYARALVLGAGSSGIAAARLLCRGGTDVVLVDGKDTVSLREKTSGCEALGVRTMLGCRDLPTGIFDVCVTSPGIAWNSEWLEEVRTRGIDVIGELELGWRHCACPVLAITGSNGKSTLTKLCGEALRAAGRKACVGGNYGRPLCEIVLDEPDLDWCVVEVSSFQLESVRRFKPRVAVLLNLQPDHLDRHGSPDAYFRMKARIFAQMDRQDTAIVPSLDAEFIRTAAPGPYATVTFGGAEGGDYTYRDARITWAGAAGAKEVMNIGETAFADDVRGLTATAAVAAVSACGESPGCVKRAISGFEPLPHRMQQVAELAGVCYVDDSKATNLAAMAAGIRMSGRPVRLIAGGLLKEKGLESMKELLANHATHVYVIGRAAEAMRVAWQDVVQCTDCGRLQDAVMAAAEDARPGETVLLSPGCASFDQFENFEQRGREFKRLVDVLREER